MKIRTFHSSWGEDYKVVLTKDAYQVDNSLAVVMNEVDDNGDIIDYFDILTVNLPGYMNAPDEAFIDTNNLSNAMEFIRKENLGKKIGVGHSGFCTYPLVKFNMEELDA